MFTYFPVWDVSWLVAVTFTVGSMVWVINGFFVDKIVQRSRSLIYRSESRMNGSLAQLLLNLLRASIDGVKLFEYSLHLALVIALDLGRLLSL